jgi:hypothetical protein
MNKDNIFFFLLLNIYIFANFEEQPYLLCIIILKILYTSYFISLEYSFSFFYFLFWREMLIRVGVALL